MGDVVEFRPRATGEPPQGLSCPNCATEWFHIVESERHPFAVVALDFEGSIRAWAGVLECFDCSHRLEDAT